MNYRKLILIIILLSGCVQLQSIRAQTSLKSLSQSNAGKIISSNLYNINFIIGQSTTIGNLESGSFSLNAGFINTTSNIFRTINLISSDEVEILIAGEGKKIEWNANYINSINISFSSNNGVDWTTIAESIDASTLNYTWTIPEINSDECFIRLIDATNDGIFDQNIVPFKIFTYSKTLSVSLTMNFDDFTKTESFRMIGLPGKSSIPLEQLFEGAYGTDWKAAYDNGEVNNYLIEYDNSEDFNLTPGKGFWVHSKNGINFNSNIESVELNEDFEYLIPLHSGWNIISNPFLKSIEWTDLQDLNGINEIIHYYNAGYFQPSTFASNNGYYFYNVNDLDYLRVPFLSSSDPSQLGKKKSNIKSESLVLEIKDELGYSSNIKIGFDKSSTNCYDPLDKFAPPSDFERTSIRIYNPQLETDYQYLREDFRNNLNMEKGQAFNLILKIPTYQTVSLDVVELNLPEQLNINLIDTEFNNIYDLRSSKSVEINSLHVLKNFKLAIGSENFIDSIKSEHIVDDFELYQNYPNPFNPNTYIKFSVVKEDLYTINISNILGEFIQTLHNGHLKSGTYEFEFVADNLPSGVYFYSINSKSFSDTKKMILLK